MELLDAKLEQYLDLMIQDGFSREEAIVKANKSTLALSNKSKNDGFPAALEKQGVGILMDPRNVKTVLRYLEILLPTLGRQKIEQYLYKNIDDMFDRSVYRYMDKIGRYFEKDFIDTLYTKISESKEVPLGVLSCVPLSEIPDSLDKSIYEFALEEKWVTLKNVRIAKRINQYIGTCGEMENRFESVFDRESPSYGDFTLVYVQNTLVGTIKMKGEKCFVGLRNVSSDDKLPVILGGTYGTNAQITNMAIDARYSQAGFGRMYLDELRVMPLRILGRYKEISRMHIKRLKEFRDALFN